jgi:acetyl esterase/lipase
MKVLLIITALLFLVACSTLAFNKSAGFQKTKNVVYKKIDGTSLAGDLYIPNTDGLKPAVVVVHGGGWTNRSGTMDGVSTKLAKAGFVVFNITYRLAPQNRYPAPVNDVSDAITWLYDHADDYQVDTTNINGWGYSAGAHLILMAGLDKPQSPHLRGIVAGGTPADLTKWPNSPMVRKLIGEAMVNATEEWKNASPVNHVAKNSPAVFLYHGQWDKLVEPEQMTLMKEALDKQDVKVETYTVPVLGHLLTYALAGGAESRGIGFLREQKVAE